MLTEIRGGDFRSGFIGGVAGHFSPAVRMQRADLGDPISRSMVAAVYSGAVSEALGGNFRDAAISGAMVHLFNHESRDQVLEEELEKMPAKYASLRETVGNSIRSQLTSSFEKKIFDLYWGGKGAIYWLTSSEFTNIESAGKWENGSVYSFYGSPDYDQVFGRATVEYGYIGQATGFYDYYDFDSKPLGIRSFTAEAQTRAVDIVGSHYGAAPFIICYGSGC